MALQIELKAVVVPDGTSFRYRIMQGTECLLTSGKFLFEADARSCGEHIASDPVSLFDFIGRQP